jgi:nickel-dependent lactate racemase
MLRLRYGSGTCWNVDAAEACEVQPREALPSVDAYAAARRALACPIDFPPLSQATVPGDRATLAVADGVPCRSQIALGALAGLCDAGVDPEHATLLFESPLEDLDELQNQLAALHLSRVVVAVHDAADEGQQAMVGVTEAGRPLRLDRRLADSDLVIPISGRGADALAPEAGGRYAGLFPNFAHRADQARFHAPDADRPKSLPQRQQEIDEAGWLLGVTLCMNVVSGRDGGVADVLAGAPDAVAEQARRRRDELWTCTVPARGDLAIALIGGGSAEQTWDNVARAVAAAAWTLQAGGAIAICTELAAPPGPALGQLRDALDYETVVRRLLRERSVDARAALTLARALARGPIYLLSRLAPKTVEGLGMTPIRDEAELNRLIRAHRRCVVLPDAQHLTFELDDAYV